MSDVHVSWEEIDERVYLDQMGLEAWLDDIMRDARERVPPSMSLWGALAMASVLKRAIMEMGHE